MSVILQAIRNLFSWFPDREDRHSTKTFQSFDAFEKYVDNPPPERGFIVWMKINLKRPMYYSPICTTIPTNIDQFHHLKSLSISGCCLTHIPWNICNLKELQTLDLSYNWLRELPYAVGWLPNLEELNLEANMLICLPTSFLYLQKLKKLNVNYNYELVGPTYSCCLAGVDAVRSQLARRLCRRNLFEKHTVFYDSKSALSDSVKFPSLLMLSVDCILRSGQDFLTPPHVPPPLKQMLVSSAETDRRDCFPYIKVTKCSLCQGYFSNKHIFDAHSCREETEPGHYITGRLANFMD